MKAKDVNPGWFYWVKVSGKIVPCRVRQRYERVRFEVVNMITKRTILLRTAKRIRRPLTVGEVKDLNLPPPKWDAVPEDVPGGKALKAAMLPEEKPRKEGECETHSAKLVIR